MRWLSKRRREGFLRHMVRNLVGVLVEVGRGEREADSVREVLAGRNRALAGVNAPPQGLSLVCVDYGDKLPPEPLRGPRKSTLDHFSQIWVSSAK